MQRLFSIAAAAMLGVLVSTPAEAQRIRIGSFGGVSIRVPFVSVDVLPFGGGTRVRAPLTSVNTGLYSAGRYPYYGRPVYGVPYHPGPTYYSVPVPRYHAPPLHTGPNYHDPIYRDSVDYTPSLAPPPYQVPERSIAGAITPQADRYEAARPNDQGDLSTSLASTKQQLRESAERLQRSLANRRDDADVWLDYLRPGQILATLDGERAPDELGDLLMNYEGVAGNPDLTGIWSADGFWQTHRGLTAWLAAGDGKAAEIDSAPSLVVPIETTPL